jgi:hypothetical protein
MANKKISELPIINELFESQDIIIPIVVDNTTHKVDSDTFTRFINRDNPTTGSNIFIGNQTITGSVIVTEDSVFKKNLIIEGNITAQAFFSEYVSSSIIYESGSTKFGDTLDDLHQFTGSLRITGSLITNGLDIYTSSVRLNGLTSSLLLATQSLYTFTQSANSRLGSIETYTSSLKTALTVNGTTSSLYNVVVSGALTLTGSLNTDSDIYPNGIRVGRGGGNLITNTVIGYNAGSNTITGNSNIFIGYSAQGSSGTTSNQIVIGSGSIGFGDNTTYIGNNLTTKTFLAGNLLLGSTTQPIGSSERLQVIGDARVTRLFIDSGASVPYPFSLYTNVGDVSAYIHNQSATGFGLLIKNASNNENYILDARGNGDVPRFRVQSDGKVLLGVTSNDGVNRLQVTGSVIADSFVKRGGVSTQFLKADGSVDDTTYATTGSNIFRGDQTITGSLSVGNGITGSTNFNTLVNKPTLVSGSSQITYSGLTGIPSGIVSSSGQVINLLPSGTVSGSLQVTISSTTGYTAFSSSLTTTDNALSTRIGTIESRYATTGSNTFNGYIQLTPTNFNINTTQTSSYIFVSGSTSDLYFAENSNGFNNLVRLRWLEGNMYTGLLSGGILSTVNGTTTFNMSSGSGIIVTLNANTAREPYPTIKYVSWNNFTNQSITNLTTAIQTFIAIDQNGNIIQQTTPYDDGQYNTLITIGTVLHQNKSTTNGSISYPNVAYGYKQRTYDFIKAFGPLKLSGYTILPSGSLGLNLGSGTAFADGRNYQNDPNNPSYINDPGTTISKIFRYYQSGSDFIFDNNGALGYTTLDVAHYNPDGLGVLQPVPGNGSNRQYSIQRVFWYPNSTTKAFVVYYGTRSYPTLTDAVANIQYESFLETANTQQNAVYLGAIAIRNNGSFTDSTSYAILPAGIFRSIGGSGGGGTAPSARLIDLVDVTVTSPTDYQPIVYSTTLGKFINSSTISASLRGAADSAITASYAINATASFINGGNTFGSNVTIGTNDNYSLGIETNGNTRMTVTSTGNVLIGQTNDNGTGRLQLTGDISINNTKLSATSSVLNSGIQTASVLQTGSYTSGFYNYTVISSSNTRAGQVITVWNGNQIQFTDVSTLDIGNTTAVVFTASLSGQNVLLTTVLPSNGWTIKTLENLL